MSHSNIVSPVYTPNRFLRLFPTFEYPNWPAAAYKPPTFCQWVWYHWKNLLGCIFLGAVAIALLFFQPFMMYDYEMHVDYLMGKIPTYAYSGHGPRPGAVWSKCPIWLVGSLAAGFPLLLYVWSYLLVKSFWDVNNAVRPVSILLTEIVFFNLWFGQILGTGSAIVIAGVIDSTLKALIGGPRPYFAAICNPMIPSDSTSKTFKIADVCHPLKGHTMDWILALQSFPSGHTAIAFAGFTFLHLWLRSRLLSSQKNIAWTRWSLFRTMAKDEESHLALDGNIDVMSPAAALANVRLFPAPSPSFPRPRYRVGEQTFGPLNFPSPAKRLSLAESSQNESVISLKTALTSGPSQTTPGILSRYQGNELSTGHPNSSPISHLPAQDAESQWSRFSFFRRPANAFQPRNNASSSRTTTRNEFHCPFKVIENHKKTLCRNMQLYGKCCEEKKGCSFTHDVNNLEAKTNHDRWVESQKGLLSLNNFKVNLDRTALPPRGHARLRPREPPLSRPGNQTLEEGSTRETSTVPPLSINSFPPYLDGTTDVAKPLPPVTALLSQRRAQAPRRLPLPTPAPSPPSSSPGNTDAAAYNHTPRSVGANFLTLFPLLLATLIGSIVVTDHIHHWWDALAGALIGIICAWASWNNYYVQWSGAPGLPLRWIERDFKDCIGEDRKDGQGRGGRAQQRFLEDDDDRAEANVELEGKGRNGRHSVVANTIRALAERNIAGMSVENDQEEVGIAR